MAITSLAIKYRPQTWNDLVEQDSIKSILTYQLETRNFAHVYLFVGGAGTGKTTSARILANTINKGFGSPIEMDAASNNSVDDVRSIIQQAQTKSLSSEYKVFVIDECVTGDVEILTSTGFKRFDCLDGNEKVAQYLDDGTIEFVEPLEFIQQHYSGNLKVWNPRNWCTVKMTPHHVQPLHYIKSDMIKDRYIQDVKFNQHNNLIVSGKGVGTKQTLSPIDRLVIVSQADGTLQGVTSTYSHWSIQLKKERKISRLLNIFKQGGIEYNEIKSREGYRRFTYNLPIEATKQLNTYFNLDMSYSCARDFIEEVSHWDGSISDDYIYYSSIIKDNVDFVSSIATLGGYSSRLRTQEDNRSDPHNTIYRLYLYDRTYSNCQHIGKTMHEEYYDGLVYCVRVPSQKIVVRSQGFTFVTGNCHSISNQGWQAFLKIIEEPPEKVIFIFCTTNPEKIPKTILSRVQRYDFRRISYSGIVNRLKYVCDVEFGKDSYEDEALGFIAKLADGGMRDALTTLDKVVAYSKNITVKNVTKALGITGYERMFKLLGVLEYKQMDAIIKIIEDVYMEGNDLKQFIKQFSNFILDVCKYQLLGNFDYTQIPNTYEKDLKAIQIDVRPLLDILIKLQSDIKWETNPKALIESTLILGVNEL